MVELGTALLLARSMGFRNSTLAACDEGVLAIQTSIGVSFLISVFFLC
jgi:hypothetical protein